MVRKHYLILNLFYLIYLVLYDFKINKVRICDYKKAFLILTGVSVVVTCLPVKLKHYS